MLGLPGGVGRSVRAVAGRRAERPRGPGAAGGGGTTSAANAPRQGAPPPPLWYADAVLGRCSACSSLVSFARPRCGDRWWSGCEEATRACCCSSVWGGLLLGPAFVPPLVSSATPSRSREAAAAASEAARYEACMRLRAVSWHGRAWCPACVRVMELVNISDKMVGSIGVGLDPPGRKADGCLRRWPLLKELSNWRTTARRCWPNTPRIDDEKLSSV